MEGPPPLAGFGPHIPKTLRPTSQPRPRSAKEKKSQSRSSRAGRGGGTGADSEENTREEMKERETLQKKPLLAKTLLPRESACRPRRGARLKCSLTERDLLRLTGDPLPRRNSTQVASYRSKTSKEETLSLPLGQNARCTTIHSIFTLHKTVHALWTAPRTPRQQTPQNVLPKQLFTLSTQSCCRSETELG